MEFTVDLTHIKDECASCGNLLIKEEDDAERYIFYRKNADSNFEEKSIPLCYGCWIDKADVCNSCALPMGLAFYNNNVGDILLKHTTIVDSSNQTYLCINCAPKI